MPTFTLYQIRNKRMTAHVADVRNSKRLAAGAAGAITMLEDLRANSWSLRAPVAWCWPTHIAHFCLRLAQKECAG